MDEATLKKHHALVQAAAKDGNGESVISALMRGCLALLRGSGLELPIDWGDIIRQSMVKRGKPRFLVNPRSDASEAVRVFMERKRWHSGRSSSLWGPMISNMRVGSKEFDRIDTLAMLVVALVVGNVDHSSSRRWARILRGD